jgi:hypothetical protein
VLALAATSLAYNQPLVSSMRTHRMTASPIFGMVMAAACTEEETAAATAAALAVSTVAEKFAVKGGNGGDLHGMDGIEPVINAASEAAGGVATVKDALEDAGRMAAARTNANAARIADSIITAAKFKFGASPEVAKHPITGEARYGSLYTFSAAPWDPEA